MTCDTARPRLLNKGGSHHRGRSERWRLTAIALLAGLWGGARLAAAVPGLPQVPTLVPAPVLWADSGNDNLSDGVLNHDDFRTGTIEAGYLGRHLAFAVNASVLTDRIRQTRNDQVTSTVGYALSDRDGSYLSAGIGVRAWGDFGGQDIQNHIHRISRYPTLQFTYDDVTRIDPLAYICGRSVHLVRTPEGISWLVPPGRWGVQTSAAGLATGNGDVEGDIEVDALFVGAQGSTYLGVQLHDEGGNLPGTTARVVAGRERGWWLMAGCGLQPSEQYGLMADVGIDPHSRGGFGRVGIDVHPRVVQEPGDPQPVEQDVGFYSGSVIGVQYRWQPQQMTAREPPWMQRMIRSEVLLDYRFGGIPHAQRQDIKATSDQLLIGHALTLVTPALLGLRLEPYGYGAVGVRVEQLMPQGPQAAVGEQQGIRGVVQFGAGVRLATDFAHCASSWQCIDRFQLGAGVDRWFPWHEADASSSQGRLRYQRPGSALGAYLGYIIDW